MLSPFAARLLSEAVSIQNLVAGRRDPPTIYEGKLRRQPSHLDTASHRVLGDDVPVRTAGDASPIDQAAVAAQLRAVTVGLVRRLRSTASPGDLTWSQESALLRLETSGPQTISQLARAEGTRSQSMGAIVAVLEAQGLVDRSADANDGRQSIVTVTDVGRRSRDEARAVKQDWLTERLTRELDQRELGVLAQAVPLLRRIVDFTSESSPGGPL
jgi:DNA-binding MarR family transcriptional regulator